MPFAGIPVGEVTCRPFTYEAGPAITGSWIGGCPPRIAVPRFDIECQKYFGTIELGGGQSVSIFYSFDILGNDQDRDIISHNNRPLFPSELIHAVTHESDMSSGSSAVVAEVSCHQITIDMEQRDVAVVDGTMPYPHSKIGGQPFIDNVARVGRVFEQLRIAGFGQLLQFDTPNPTTHSFVDGFPWDPGWLHVLVRGATTEECEFAFVVQQ